MHLALLTDAVSITADFIPTVVFGLFGNGWLGRRKRDTHEYTLGYGKGGKGNGLWEYQMPVTVRKGTKCTNANVFKITINNLPNSKLCFL